MCFFKFLLAGLKGGWGWDCTPSALLSGAHLAQADFFVQLRERYPLPFHPCSRSHDDLIQAGTENLIPKV